MPLNAGRKVLLLQIKKVEVVNAQGANTSAKD